jgi:hypothetical protein
MSWHPAYNWKWLNKVAIKDPLRIKTTVMESLFATKLDSLSFLNAFNASQKL